ncbi:hypothetical protein Tco_1391857 [Tanacetum coccineum]
MKVEESLNIKFDESPPPKSPPLVDDDLLEINIIENQDKDLEVKENEPLNKEIANIKESKDHPIETVIGSLNQRTLRSQVQNQSIFCFVSSVEPKNIKEAIQDESWSMAMQEELKQFKTNDVWSLIPPPKNQTIIVISTSSHHSPRKPKESKTNLQSNPRDAVRPGWLQHPQPPSPPYQPLSPPSDYTSGPLPTSPISTSPISPTHHNSDLLTTPRSTPPSLTSPPPAPTQPSKLTSPLAINLDPIELLFSTPPTSPQAFLDSLDDLPPSTTNPPPPRPSFDTIKRMANAPPPIPPIDSTFPLPTLNLEPPILPFLPQCFTKSYFNRPTTSAIRPTIPLFPCSPMKCFVNIAKELKS